MGLRSKQLVYIVSSLFTKELQNCFELKHILALPTKDQIYIAYAVFQFLLDCLILHIIAMFLWFWNDGGRIFFHFEIIFPIFWRFFVKLNFNFLEFLPFRLLFRNFVKLTFLWRKKHFFGLVCRWTLIFCTNH